MVWRYDYSGPSRALTFSLSDNGALLSNVSYDPATEMNTYSVPAPDLHLPSRHHNSSSPNHHNASWSRSDTTMIRIGMNLELQVGPNGGPYSTVSNFTPGFDGFNLLYWGKGVIQVGNIQGWTLWHITTTGSMSNTSDSLAIRTLDEADLKASFLSRTTTLPTWAPGTPNGYHGGRSSSSSAPGVMFHGSLISTTRSAVLGQRLVWK